MTDELITDLAQIHSLRVISRTSVVQFKHSKKKLPEIASELNVDAVVEGSVLRTGNDVRVTAQLLDARADRHLWASSYEQEMGNVLRLQAQIAKTIAEQVHASLTSEEGSKLATRPSTNPQSYDALLTGRYLFNRRNPADTEKAIVYLRRAVELDPQNGPAWATLAYCYTALGADLGASDPAKVLPLARSAINKALQIDPDLAEAHVTLAWMKLWYDWDWAGSEREFQRAQQLSPNDSATYREYAHLLQDQKRFDEAIAEDRRAIDLAPLDILSSAHLAWTYVDANEGAKAVEQGKHVLDMDPNFTGAYLLIALGYEEQGKWPEAVSAYDRSREQYPADYLPAVAYVYAASGDKVRAQAAFATLVEYSRKNYVSPMNFAACYAARGDKDHAFEWLEKAYKQRATGMIGLSVNRHLENLHSDSRFKDLLRRMRLPD
jgi:tetratricopeptide (TPR) repeat protein